MWLLYLACSACPLIRCSLRSRSRGRGRGRKRYGTGRRPGRPPKFIRLDPPAGTSADKTVRGMLKQIDILMRACITGKASGKHFFSISKQEMLELAEKQPLEERTENGLMVVEMEPEAETETEAETQPILPTGESLAEPVTPPSSTDTAVPLKEDPGQNNQPEAHLTSQDMRRAKRIRVRRPTLCAHRNEPVSQRLCFTAMCLSS